MNSLPAHPSFVDSSGPAVTVRLPPPAPAGGKPRQGWLLFLLMAVAGAAFGYFGAKFAAQLLLPADGGRVVKLLLLAAVPFVWLFTVGWHELGHLLGGRLAGGRFLLFIIGPFQWQRSPAGIRFSWNRRINLAGGMAACLPLDQHNLPRRFALMIAGGPVASLVLVVFAAWVAAAFASGGQVLAQHVAMLTALLSGIIFVVTVIPGEAGGLRTDGRRLLNLLGEDATARQEAALLSLTVAGLNGTRPADYAVTWLEAAIAANPGSLHTLYGHFSAYLHHADRGEHRRAQRHLDEVMTGEACLPPFMRNMARAEYAWLRPATRADAAAARAWLETAGPTDLDPSARLRAEAAVLLAEGRPAEAAAKAQEGLEAVDHGSLALVRSEFAADALQAIINEYAQTGVAPPR